jgi:nitrate reductase beta subunit
LTLSIFPGESRTADLGFQMRDPDDHYAILGVAKYADRRVIKAAYRALAKKYHSDVAGGSAERFREIDSEPLERVQMPLGTGGPEHDGGDQFSSERKQVER